MKGPADPRPILSATTTADRAVQQQSFNPMLLALIPAITGTLTKGAQVGTWVYDILTVINGATTGYVHPLGRIPNGFLILNANADIDFWITDADLAAFTTTTAQWHASAAGKVRGFWL